METLKLIIASTISVLCLDGIWLGVISKSLYSEALGHLMRKNSEGLAPNWSGAVIVYVLIIMGVMVFALPKAGLSYTQGLLWGGVLGFMIYGVYDFTNYALLAGWPLTISLIDMAWGTVLCALTTCSAVAVRNWLHS